jgi:L-ectoine synthase
MIIRSLKEIQGTQREVKAPTFTSRRFLLKNDQLGFSLHDTILYAGTATSIWYKYHVEAVYCIEGEGELEVLPEGPVYGITPGTLYALDSHEKHILRAKTNLRMVCVFTPPLTGQEVHNDEGIYPLIDY